MKRFLSIDWDYFINATAEERMLYFPDSGNEDLPESMQSLIWDGLYCNPKLVEFDILRKDYRTIQGILKHYAIQHGHSDDTLVKFGRSPIRVSISHAVMYDFVGDLIRNQDEEFEIYNVDFHHDKYDYHTRSKPVNCGNWVNVLQEMYPNMKYYWIKREDSETEILGGEVEAEVRTIEDLKDIEFDYVFMCRSDCWSPPHLDKYFYQLYTLCADFFPLGVDIEKRAYNNHVREIPVMESLRLLLSEAYRKEEV